MMRKTRKHLEESRRKLLDEASRQLLDGNSSKAKEKLEEAELRSELLAYHNNRENQEWLWAVALAAISAVLVGFSMTKNVSKSKITLKTKCESVEFTLKSAWSLDRQDLWRIRRVELDGLDTVEPDWLLPGTLKDPKSEKVLVRGTDIWLGRLTAEPGSRIEMFRSSPEEGELRVRGRVTGVIDMNDKVFLSTINTNTGARADTNLTLAVTETIGFESRGLTAIPIIIRFELSPTWKVHNIPICRLSFAQPVPGTVAGDITWRTTVKSGHLVLHDTQKEMELNGPVSLNGVDGLGASTMSDDEIEFAFTGAAERVKIGPDDYQRDVTPNLLTYYYHQKPDRVFWLAVLLVWGWLWSFKSKVR